ncbi:MarR family winged helix-turn-helix transcriptional regulator [Glaciimonas soli]|uniref:MarR family winged helix-turn-helix transcriptional regulator n=1 Tax=Glaciimonas soli TaxID=2590999 RepID=UPI002AD56BD5|nr:MarR family transcriptional regulator [Glaciimonas soli]
MSNLSTPSTALFPVDQYSIEDSIGFMLARVRTQLSRNADELLLPFGITHAQAAILLMLSSGQHLTAADLARESYTDAASVKRMVDRLESRGLIQRMPCGHDKRVFRILLTAEGEQLKQHIPAVFCGMLSQYFEDFTAEELGFLKSMLRRALTKNTLATP